MNGEGGDAGDCRIVAGTSYVQSMCCTTELHPLPGEQQVITNQIFPVPPVSFLSDLSGAMKKNIHKKKHRSFVISVN